MYNTYNRPTTLKKDNIVNFYTHRCSWCNGTNDESFAFFIEDYKPHITMTFDPRERGVIICSECSDSVFDALSEFEVFEVDEIQD